ncbi:cofactor assembly of complex C subunit B [Lusitaniella coriacea]|uniref:cofactor assembly of complex C subunit B n=1 Tax=Lusitaniella coriacea TaxID=1983105 RepID=UPI003CF69125
MNSPILSSTFFLTLLLLVGLFFFIRASVKDRTERIELIPEGEEKSLLDRLQNYFEQRSYRIIAVDPAQQKLTFEGAVRPSGWLAIFLSGLAACGLLCLALVLSFGFPESGKIPLSLLLLSPLAGWFYWRKAGRLEQAILEVRGEEDPKQGKRAIAVTAHRDELASLQKTLKSEVPK